jgi:hypothetical protein
LTLGSRQSIIAQYDAGFWFVTQAHSSAHIGICAGGCNAGDGPKDKPDVELFLAEALISLRQTIAVEKRPAQFVIGSGRHQK